MQFGTRKADVPEGNGNYLRNFRKGETLVRFLTEVDDWTQFHEHFNTNGRSFPCTGDRDTCPGCTSSNEKVSERKRRYGVLLKLVKQDKVVPYRVPMTLGDRMTARSERNGGTILSRDFVVLKSGSGMDTEYDVDQEDKYPVDIKEEIAKAQCTVQEALAAAFEENAPGQDTGKKPVKAEREPERVPLAKDTAKDYGNPPSEPQPQKDAEAEESVDLTEAQVRDMSKSELRELCAKAGVTFDDEDTRGELADRLIASFGQ